MNSLKGAVGRAGDADCFAWFCGHSLTGARTARLRRFRPFAGPGSNCGIWDP